LAEKSIEATFEDKEVADFLKSIATNLNKVKGGDNKFAGLLSAIVFRDVIGHFTQQEGSEGPWAPWSESYLEHMKKIGRQNNMILQFTGRLRDSFRPTNFKATSEGLLWFNRAKTSEDFPYAYAHDTGGGRLPKRDFMWLSDKAVEDISEQTLNFMLDEAK